VCYPEWRTLKADHTRAVSSESECILQSWRMRIPLLPSELLCLLPCYGVVVIKTVFCIPERVAVLELVRATFKRATLYIATE
jgi:hypothetical protein